MDLELSLDFTHLFHIYNSLSFFINWHKLNTHKASIDTIQKGLWEMHRGVVSFCAKYPVEANEKEQERMITSYRAHDEKMLDTALKGLEVLKSLQDKNYRSIITK